MVMWKINAGRRSLLAQEFLDNSIVAIGWRETGDLVGLRHRDQIIQRVAAAYPDKTQRQNEVAGNQIWRFLNEIEEGDEVITYDPISRLYHLGKIAGAPQYQPELVEKLPTVRAVKWMDAVERDKLSSIAKGKLGAILTLFQVPPIAAQELRDLAGGIVVKPEELDDAEGEEESGGAVAMILSSEALKEQALERVKDKLQNLGWEEMQEMVAALLRALGYRTIVSPRGADRGRDIIASRDGFGFERPRIVVEVKHRKGAMGAPEIRSFLSALHNDDRGLYVSTGGFSREAHYQAENASKVTHLMSLDGLAQALIDQYEALDEQGKKLLPLTRIYWPA